MLLCCFRLSLKTQIEINEAAQHKLTITVSHPLGSATQAHFVANSFPHARHGNRFLPSECSERRVWELKTCKIYIIMFDSQESRGLQKSVPRRAFRSLMRLRVTFEMVQCWIVTSLVAFTADHSAERCSTGRRFLPLCRFPTTAETSKYRKLTVKQCKSSENCAFRNG